MSIIDKVHKFLRKQQRSRQERLDQIDERIHGDDDTEPQLEKLREVFHEAVEHLRKVK